MTAVGAASDGFPVTPDAFDTTYNGVQDSMVVRIDMNTAGAQLYGSYLGGENVDVGVGVAVHGPTDVIIVDATFSAAHPVAACAYDDTFNGDVDAAALRLDLCPIDLDDSGSVGVTALLVLANWGPCP